MTETSTAKCPQCACHGWRACIHADNGNPAAEGRDIERGLNWHCIASPGGCEGYSLILLLKEEWLSDEERLWLAGFRARRGVNEEAEG